MSTLKYLMIHCTATRLSQTINDDSIKQMHLGPCPQKDGSLIYKGKKYANRQALPKESIGGVEVAKLTGRGWRKVGYTDMIMPDGSIINLTPNNNDGIVDSWEITNGALGMNQSTKHIVYVGGLSENLKAADTRTVSQIATLKSYVEKEVARLNTIKVLGHNQAANKACPSFFVPNWLRTIGIKEANIYTADPFGYGKIFK